MRYRFESYVLDTQRYELWHHGVGVPLRPKVFDVLVYLIRQRDRVVSKTELLEQVWPGQFIGDGSLNACLMAVRKVLGDSGQEQRCIHTLRGRGYRFMASVQEEADESLTVQAPPEPDTPPALPSQALPPAVPSMVLPDAERRHLTVLHCAVVEATRLAEQLDPEVFHNVMQAYHQTCTAVMQRFDGYVAQYQDSGLLVYFGYPQAHDDDAQRAVRAGLALLEALAAAAPRLTIRVGIDTGLVVVGASSGEGSRLPLALGSTPHLAGLIQESAPTDTVVMSTATYRLVASDVRCGPLGEHTLRGMDHPSVLYRALQDVGGGEGFLALRSRGLTPLVGRDAEVALLLDRWRHVQAGQGQVVVLSGEAGIGKSRLLHVMQEHLGGAAPGCLQGRCTPYDQHSAWYPLLAPLSSLLQWHQDDTPVTKLASLELVVRQCGLSLAETVPGLALLLSLPLPAECYSLPLLDPQHQRRQILSAVLALLVASAARHPLLLMLEDLHWSDPSTLELLERLVDYGPAAAIYLVVTCRPPFQPTWIGRAHVTLLVLNRLTRAHAEAMIARVAGLAPLPAEVRQHLVEHTDGVPLFIEELTKTVLESAAVPQTQAGGTALPFPALSAIPATLHDSLMARLDRLGTAKRLAQVGAVIGREFSYALLQAVTAGPDATLQPDLVQLVASELLYQRGVPPQATYVFKHALIRDAAYQALLHQTRRQVHQRLVAVCSTDFPQIANTQPELLAHHATEAGLFPQALDYWQRAGTQAFQRGAYPEALAHLQRGLALLSHLPAEQRLRQELELSLALAPVLLVVQGSGSPEVERLCSRAYALSQQVEATPHLFPALRGLQYVAWTQGQLQVVQELAEQLLALAQATADPMQRMEAHLAMGTTLWYLGLLAPALTHLEQGLAHRHAGLRQTYQRVPHPELACLLYSGLVLWYLGYAEQAQRRIQEGLELAQQLPQPYHLVWAQHLGAFWYRLCGQTEPAQVLTARVVQAATVQGMGLAVASGLFVQEWALAEQSLPEFEQLQPPLAAYRARSGPLGLAQHLAWLAEAYGQRGQYTDGFLALAAAHRLVSYTGEQLVTAELQRLRGELLRHTSPVPQPCTSGVPEADAEASLQHALAIARQQHAKALELRAAVSLSRRWQQQGHHARARELLGMVYGWFTEGFDTADLREARALLEALR